MLSFLLLAQLAAASPNPDSVYATPALRHLVERAAVENRFPPPALHSYRSRIETELSLMIRDTLGREQSAEVEQLATDATWVRGDRYDLHIVGYRSQNIGVPYSTLSFVRAWTVPTLYGNRLSLGAYFNASRGRRDTLVAVHPFADDRDRFYRFTGGDTVTTLRAGARAITVVRVRVHPVLRDTTRLGAFDGEIDLDAERAQIIRMRGRFVVAATRGRFEKVLGVVAAAYAEFVNAEVDGAYWLPTFQRTEFQASMALLGQTRPVFRLVSSISRISINGTTVAPPDTTSRLRVTVTWAPSDSVDSFGDWERGIGVLTGSVHADDFDDVAPDAWRSVGPPRLVLFPTTVSRVVRFNRVEGLFIGVAPAINFRSAVPGLTVGAFGGWAFGEQTARGGAFVSYRQPRVILSARAERALASTNDFVPPLSDDPGFGALIGSVDNYDYVDRRSATISATRMIGSVAGAIMTVDAGVENDRSARANIEHGLFSSGTRFRANRGVAEGTSTRVGAEIELHPSVNGEFVEPGIGARFRYDLARGDLDWMRVEGRLTARKYVGPVSIAAQADGGAVIGASLPPQRLFELGGDESLPGYDYKQFVGDRAALFRTFISYRLGIWQRPHRVWGGFMLPGASPGIAASAQGAWSELSSAGAVVAASALTAHTTLTPPEPTHGARATAGAGVTLFSDVLHLGVARPVDRAAPLRFVAGFGAAF